MKNILIAVWIILAIMLGTAQYWDTSGTILDSESESYGGYGYPVAYDVVVDFSGSGALYYLIDDHAQGYIEIRKTALDGTEDYFVSLGDPYPIDTKGDLSPDGSKLAMMMSDGSSGTSLVISLVDTSDGSYEGYEASDLLLPYDRGSYNIDLKFSPSGDSLFAETSDGNYRDVGTVWKLDLTSVTTDYVCKDFINNSTVGGQGQVTGFVPLDDDTIFAIYIKEGAELTMQIRFVKYNFGTDTFDWMVQTDCISRCDVELSDSAKIIQTEIQISDDFSSAKVFYNDIDGFYFFTVDMSDGSTSSIYKLGTLESTNYFYWSKFISDTVIAFYIDDIQDREILFYDYSDNSYVACVTNYDVYGISVVLDGAKLVHIVGDSGYNTLMVMKLDYDMWKYSPLYFGELDSTKEYTISSESNVFSMSSYTETYVGASTGTPTSYTSSNSDITYAVDTNSDTNMKMRAYVNDATEITITQSPSFTGQTDAISHVCFADVSGDITYQPTLSTDSVTFDFVDDSWILFDDTTDQFNMTAAPAGTYTAAYEVIYNDPYGYYPMTITIEIRSSSSSSSHCMDTSSDAGWGVLIAFIVLMGIGIIVVVVLGVVYVIKRGKQPSSNGNEKTNQIHVLENNNPHPDVENEQSKLNEKAE